MSVSANRLFHFTNKKSLINILKNNFIPYFSMEKIFHDELEIAIPMVSFCDIPLSQITDHIHQYGHYAIGLSKEWGINNKLNPVFYYNTNSILHNRVREFLKHEFILAHDNKGFALGDVFKIKTLFTYIYFSKPYKGSNWNKKKQNFESKERTLYNEREWRYIPEENQDAELNFIFKNVFLNKDALEKLNKRLQNKKLLFTPNDIKYIIVQKENEIIEIIKQIEKIKKGYMDDQLRILSSRIITSNQIFEDF